MLNLLKLKKVKLFIEASRKSNWKSNYSLGELVQVKYFDGEDTKIIYEDDRRSYYTGTASKYVSKHGSLTLVIDGTRPRNRYEVIEVSSRGKKTFCWDCESKRHDDLKNGIITIHNFGMFMERFTATSNYHKAILLGKGRHVSYSPNVEISSYWENSNVTFHALEIENEDGEKSGVRRKWEEMKHSGNFDYHHSPCRGSASEYLVNSETGDIYRYSDHWGYGIRDCNWFLENKGKCCNGVAIGCANISEFKSNILIEAIFYNFAEIEELSFAIDEDIKQLEMMKDLYTCEDGVLKLTENEISRLRKKKKELLADYNLYNQDSMAFFEPKIAR